MKTTLLYLTEPSAYTAEGSILAIGTDPFGTYIVVDRTPAYPQGGGQPGDRGTIQVQGTELRLLNVRRVDDQVRHYITEPNFNLDTTGYIIINIDASFRRSNSVLHTAGHLIACLAHCLYPQLMPVKGYHFADGAYVEFEAPVQLSAIEIEEFLKASIKMDLQSEKRITIQDAKPYDLAKSPFLPENLPTGRALRLVTIEEFPAMPCGGTHVTYLREIPMIAIRKLKWSKNVLRVSYACQLPAQ